MIPAQLSEGYARALPELEALRARVDNILDALARALGGDYVSRLKTEESVFEKLVRGEWPNLHAMNDLFGGTLLLPRLPLAHDQADIRQRLEERFEILHTLSSRTKRPTEFVYDDLHFILRLKDTPLLTDKRLLRWMFELQVKSYLQHGWAKTTHPVVYKARDESWALSRVAAQTRAMVEVADAAIAQAAEAPFNVDQPAHEPIEERRSLTRALDAWWQGDLPEDWRRLGVFVADYIRLAGTTVDDFVSLLETERGQELSGKFSLAVQQAVVVLLLEQHFDVLVKQARRRNRYLPISSEMLDLSEACGRVPDDVRFAFDH